MRRQDWLALLLAAAGICTAVSVMAGQIKFADDPTTINLLWWGGWVGVAICMLLALAILLWPEGNGRHSFLGRLSAASVGFPDYSSPFEKWTPRAIAVVAIVAIWYLTSLGGLTKAGLAIYAAAWLSLLASAWFASPTVSVPPSSPSNQKAPRRPDRNLVLELRNTLGPLRTGMMRYKVDKASAESSYQVYSQARQKFAGDVSYERQLSDINDVCREIFDTEGELDNAHWIELYQRVHLTIRQLEEDTAWAVQTNPADSQEGAESSTLSAAAWVFTDEQRKSKENAATVVHGLSALRERGIDLRNRTVANEAEMAAWKEAYNAWMRDVPKFLEENVFHTSALRFREGFMIVVRKIEGSFNNTHNADLAWLNERLRDLNHEIAMWSDRAR